MNERLLILNSVAIILAVGAMVMAVKGIPYYGWVVLCSIFSVHIPKNNQL